MKVVRAAAVNGAATKENGATRGSFLELAVTADQWLAPGDAADRFVFRNVTVLGKDGQPEREWDVIRIDLSQDGTWSMTAVECAVTRTGEKDAQSREALEVLGAGLQGAYADLVGFTTQLATVENERGSAVTRLSYDDARRGFTTVS